ncbi:MAG: hypothetical protein JXO48_07820 [Deltaproteobacteria bacterium]|nr:hypothetical protein [Deltaproteobacteria bacterium]
MEVLFFPGERVLRPMPQGGCLDVQLSLLDDRALQVKKPIFSFDVLVSFESGAMVRIYGLSYVRLALYRNVHDYVKGIIERQWHRSKNEKVRLVLMLNR